ncbi:hypothetical protein [uncultured Methylobacterium sp.]|uniref:hypothetical protein n=1 Tax=uncultured Methylobacterium sp. TaxID=157278 RepID=UPI0035CB252D
MARERNILAAMIGLAAVAATLFPARARVRRTLSDCETQALGQVRAKALVSLERHWPGLDPEDAARIAMAYPACWHQYPTRMQ